MIKNCFTVIPATVVKSVPTKKGNYYNTARVNAFYIANGRYINEEHDITVRFFSRGSYAEGDSVQLAESLEKDANGYYNIAEFTPVEA